VNVNGTLFFRATDNSGDVELYKSDGTDPGTVRVKDIRTNGSSSPTSLVNVNGTLFFRATDNSGDVELYKSDGTDAVRVKDIKTNGSSSPQFLTNVNGTLFFTASDNSNNQPLYKAVDFSDDFNRADSTNLGSDWTETAGNLNIVDNQLLAIDPTGGAALVNNVSLADVRVQAEVSLLTSGNSRVDLYARATDTSNTYLGTLVANNGIFTAKIRKLVGGVLTLLTSTTVNFPTGEGVLRFEVQGGQLSLFVNDILAVSAFDTTFVSGKVGVVATQLVSLDNFSATAIAPDSFGDNFGRPDSTQLGNQWTEPVGDSVVVKQQLVAKTAGPNLAVAQGSALADVAVQSWVNVFAPAGTGLMGNAGLVARYLGSGNSNYYLGVLIGNNGVFTARISLNLNGVLTPLLTVPVATGTGLLRFEVVGNSLKLFLNGILVVKTTDTMLTRAGLVGVRGTARSSFDTFNAERLFPTLFQDSFNRPDNTDIGAAYQKVAGNFDINTNQLRALNAGTNLAIRDGVSRLNVKLEAMVTVSPSIVSEVGLVARVQDSQNYYCAAIENNGTSFTASIYKVVNNVKTRIGAAVPSGSNLGRLRFEVVGNSLKLFFNGALLIDATDTTFAGAGTVGFRGSANTVFDDFVMTR
jgi:ELWxxDGT repeat protein